MLTEITFTLAIPFWALSLCRAGMRRNCLRADLDDHIWRVLCHNSNRICRENKDYWLQNKQTVIGSQSNLRHFAL